MQLLLIVLNKVEKLDDLLEKLMEHGFTGATIINSTGMMKALAKNMENYPIFGSLRFLINLERDESKTIFMVLKDELIDKAKDTVKEVVGDLSEPDTAILFTIPVSSVEGIGF